MLFIDIIAQSCSQICNSVRKESTL